MLAKKYNIAIFIGLFLLILTLLQILSWKITLIPIFFILIYLIIGASNIRSQVFVKTIYKLETKEKKICLTFDDGPHSNSLLILDVLKKHQIQAIFFCIGKQIEKHPEIAQQIFNEGHILGNHTYNHSHTISLLPASKFRAEIDRTDAVLSKITGQKTHLFRPPYGVTNPNIAKALEHYPQAVIGWNVRSFDTLATDQEKLFQKLIHEIKAGSILLFHDTLPLTTQILDNLITELKNRGFSFTNKL